MSIKVLDPKTAAKIAAGEVVERPASVVKELVENALDAGAKQITVEIRGGGTEVIRVTDDGSGIGTEDVEVAFGRHATSKLSSIEDLSTVVTLGFRGEALPSIAAVAEVELVTRVEGTTSGDSVIFENGSMVKHTSAARSRGTTISVKNLFRNVPARLRFLKSAATENGRSATVVSRYALAFPGVKFTLSVEGRKTLQTPGSGRLTDTALALYGVETAGRLLPVKYGDAVWNENHVSEIGVEGLVGPPTVSKGNRNELLFFVNRRSIDSRLLSWAVEEAYQGSLMVGRHPMAILNITIPPGEVDVNVHPTKSEVKFRDERAVASAVQRAVRAALGSVSNIPKVASPEKPYHGGQPAPADPLRLWDEMHKIDTEAPSPIPTNPTGSSSKLPVLRLLGQVDRNYLVAEGPDGLYIIDQHAAHERIVYEKIKKQMALKAADVQGLLSPATLQLTPQEDATLNDRLEEMTGAGFQIDPFGERTYLVRAVPSILATEDWQAAFQDILNEPAQRETDKLDSMARSLACHGVVRAGQVLDELEMRALVRDLEGTHDPFHCPHGRPTLIQLTFRQLEKDFGRT